MHDSNQRFRQGRASSAFTLLELLVVLSILGLVTAVALPNLNRAMDSLRSRLDKDHLYSAINELPLRAFYARSDMLLKQDEKYIGETKTQKKLENAAPFVLELNPGWSFETSGILYRSTGICTGGELALLHNDQYVWQGQLTAPFCQLPVDAL